VNIGREEAEEKGMCRNSTGDKAATGAVPGIVIAPRPESSVDSSLKRVSAALKPLTQPWVGDFIPPTISFQPAGRTPNA
jgi:hypothetical protein